MITSLVYLVQHLLAKEKPSSSDLGRREILYLMETRGQIFQAAYYILPPESQFLFLFLLPLQEHWLDDRQQCC